jgi:monoamine oxidase
VIGAGLSGLAAADELNRVGVDVEVFEARDRVGGRVWSVPFAGATIERGAEFILPHDGELIAAAQRLGLTLVRKCMLYGDREPRGGEPVSRAQVAAAIDHIRALPTVEGENVYGALTRARIGSGVADAIAARLEVSCAYSADDLDASVLREAARSFGDFDTHTVQGGNDRVARALAESLGDAVHVSAPVRAVSCSGREVRVVADAGEATADAAVVAVPASVIDAIQFDPPLPEAKVTAPPQRALRRCGEAVRRAAHTRAAERDALGARALLVLHAAGRRRRAVAVRGRIRWLEPGGRRARRARGPGPLAGRAAPAAARP